MYLVVSGSTHFLCPPCRLLFFFFVVVRHVCCVQVPFHCTEAFNAESATRVMFITLSIFVKSFDKHNSGNALLIQSFSVMKCVHDNRPRSALFFLYLCVCVRVRVCSSGPLVCPAWALSLSVSRRVWEVGRAAQIDPQTSEPRARNRRFLCRWGAVCISGSQGEAKQKQHPVNTSTPALKQKKKTENMEHSPENVEERLLLKMQCCVIQDLHQQKCRWEENISQRRMN